MRSNALNCRGSFGGGDHGQTEDAFQGLLMDMTQAEKESRTFGVTLRFGALMSSRSVAVADTEVHRRGVPH